MTANEARDIVYTMIALALPGWTIIWDDIPSEPPASEVAWFRVTMRHISGRQSSLSGEVGARKFESNGTIFVQVFSPAGQGKSEAYDLAQIVADAFREAKLDVWFRNTRINEVGVSGAFQQINVLTDFVYDDVR